MIVGTAELLKFWRTWWEGKNKTYLGHSSPQLFALTLISSYTYNQSTRGASVTAEWPNTVFVMVPTVFGLKNNLPRAVMATLSLGIFNTR